MSSDSPNPNTSAAMSSRPVPALRRFVLYTLTEDDARNVNGYREQAIWRQGNKAHEGDVFPMLVVKAWGDEFDSLVNGQVFLDGNDTLWVTSVHVGTKPGTFRWGDRT